MKKYYFIPVAIWAVTALFSLCIMLLWNWLLPSIFGFPLISFWQSLGLLLLSKLFFGGLGPRGWGRHPIIAEPVVVGINPTLTKVLMAEGEPTLFVSGGWT